VGAYRTSPTGSAREFGRIRRNMLLDLLPVGLHKDRQSLRIGRPFWARFVPAARRNGYEFGEHVLGALSGIHGATLRALGDGGFFAMPPDYRALTVEEDVLLGLGAKAVPPAGADRRGRVIRAWYPGRASGQNVPRGQGHA
jgi:hypothetical protein